jgi:arsenate reductase
MVNRTLNVLFLCTGNTARSIMAEVMLNSMGQGRFKAYSAGSHPKGAVNRLAVELLQKNRLPIEGLRSKSWEEFSQSGAPVMDFVITVCDQAAGEVCPIWPGQPMNAHWGIEDPVAAEGSEEEKRKAFFTAYNRLRNRLSIFTSLPMSKLDRLSLQRRLDDIGKLREKGQ